MKRVLLLFVVLLSLFTLIACGGETVTVTFETNGGNVIDAMDVNLENPISLPDDPTREGFIFDGWFIDEALEEALSSGFIPTENITLYAKWRPAVVSYTVTFVTGFDQTVAAQTVVEDATATVPEALTRAGHTFGGWYSDEALTTVYDFETAVTENMTIYAKWVPIQLNVVYESNGGSAIETVSQDYGTATVAPENPTRFGYIFDGWFTDRQLTQAYDFDSEVVANLRLYAKWSPDLDAISQMITEDIEAVDIENNMVATSALLDLPAKGTVHNSNILWTTGNNAVISRTGVVYHPTRGEDDVTVTLTARVINGPVTETFTFDILVPAKAEVEIASEALLPFTNMTGEYDVLDGDLLTFYAENGALPYVDIRDFLALLDGLLYFEELEFAYVGHVLTISYQIVDEIEDEFGNVIDTETYDYFVTIDFDLNTVTLESLSFFDGYIQSTATDYSQGLTYLETYFEPGNEVVFELDPYRFDLVVHETETETYFLFPFHIANILFTSGSYYNVYYNGDGYFGVYAFPDNNDPEGETEDGRSYNAMKTSSFNGEVVAPDVMIATYDALAFTLDYLFGLKDVRGVETYYTVLQNYRDTMMDGTTASLGSGIFNFVNKGLDDLHSSFHFPGYFADPATQINLTSISQVGARVAQWYDVLWAVQDVLEAAYPSSPDNIPPDYRFIDDQKTAIIYLDGFYTATVEDPDGDDSDRFMKETMQAIFAANPNVENIVVDLSYNTGGNLGALLRVLGYMTEMPIQMSYMNPTDGSNVTYFVEVETVAYDEVNWFIMTSKVTFSAANLMTSIAQHMGFATIIGTQSGGGASSITPIVLPDGTMFHMSSLNVLSYRVGNDIDGYQYFSIENGILPDYQLRVQDLHNAAKIKEVIDQANAAN